MNKSTKSKSMPKHKKIRIEVGDVVRLTAPDATVHVGIVTATKDCGSPQTGELIIIIGRIGTTHTGWECNTELLQPRAGVIQEVEAAIAEAASSTLLKGEPDRWVREHHRNGRGRR